MNLIRNGLGMRKAGDRRGASQPENPHSNRVFTQVHNTLKGTGCSIPRNWLLPRRRREIIRERTQASRQDLRLQEHVEKWAVGQRHSLLGRCRYSETWPLINPSQFLISAKPLVLAGLPFTGM